MNITITSILFPVPDQADHGYQEAAGRAEAAVQRHAQQPDRGVQGEPGHDQRGHGQDLRPVPQ